MATSRLLAWGAATANLLSIAAAQGTFIGGGPTANGTNVLNNACNRVNHQTVVKDGSLWIDGGIFTFTNWSQNNPLTRTAVSLPAIVGENEYLIQIPLNATWDWSGSTYGGPDGYQANITEIALTKSPDARTRNPVPIVEQGALFEGITGDPRLWLFGGVSPWVAMNFSGFQWPTSDINSLWSFNTSDMTWEQHDVHSSVPIRPNNGAYASAPDMGLGFWLNGEINSGSSQATEVLGSDHAIFQDGLVVLNFNGKEPTATNISTSALGWPRAGGSMQYVPTYGTEGILVMIGGGNKSDVDTDSNDSGTYMPLTDIWVYDVAMANGTNAGNGFHFQTADGDVPPNREDFCVVGVESPDNATYTIFVYGGHESDTVYDDVYALSLPSFTWSRLYSGNSTRWGHDCRLANNRQMITIGGSQTTDLTNQCDWETRGVALFDLPTAGWGSLFIDNDYVGDYSLPYAVAQSIGADGNGNNPTKTAPTNGFGGTELATLFHESPSTARSMMNKRLSGGAIAGIVVGVVAGLLIIAALVFFLAVRPRQKRRRAAANAEEGLTRDQTSEIDDGEGSGNRSDDSSQPQRAEADGREVVALEKDGEVIRPEMADTEMRFEMDATDAEVRAELPTAEKPGSDMKKPFF